MKQTQGSIGNPHNRYCLLRKNAIISNFSDLMAGGRTDNGKGCRLYCSGLKSVLVLSKTVRLA